MKVSTEYQMKLFDLMDCRMDWDAIDAEAKRNIENGTAHDPAKVRGAFWDKFAELVEAYKAVAITGCEAAQLAHKEDRVADLWGLFTMAQDAALY